MQQTVEEIFTFVLLKTNFGVLGGFVTILLFY